MSDLSRLDPPADRKPGYHPDPLGGEHPRLWDGNHWKHQVGPPVGESAWDRAVGPTQTKTLFAFLGVGLTMRILVDGDWWVELLSGIAGGFAGYGLAVVMLWLVPRLRDVWNR